MERDLSRALHSLTARLDRAADRMLRAEAGLSYSRFLTLYLVGRWGAGTQRSLAELLGVTEPSVSRMIRVLERSGLLEARADPGGGNRRQLRLTGAGEQHVQRWGALLEERLAALVEASGVPYATYTDYTKRLLATLDAREPAANRWSPLAASSAHRGPKR
jgi:DNA-binding MarR family transcriptional regulator